MTSSSSFIFIFLLLSFSLINAHTYLSSIKIGGSALPEGECIRRTFDNSPIESVSSPAMTCGKLPAGATPAAKRCPVAAGSTVGLQWYHNGPTPQDDIVDPSHKGPVMAYMAKDDGTNNINWFKVYERGYNVAADKFAVIDLIENRGLMEFKIPEDIEPGNYLIRGEMIALHEAFRIGGAQPYVGCAEVTVSGKGKAKPDTVKFPGAYSPTDPGINVNIYPMKGEYVIPGPRVYVSGSSGSGSGNNNNNDGESNSKTSDSKKGGMSAGGAAALAIFFIALVGMIAFGAFFYYRNGHVFGKTLPASVAKYVPTSSYSSSSSSSSSDRRNGAYTAYVEEAH